jgi:site-specific recombinase XerD
MKAENERLLKDFVEWMKMEGYKERGIEEKERVVKDYLEYAESLNMDIFTAGIREAEAYRESLRVDKNKDGEVRYNPKTINYRIAYLVLFYQYFLLYGKALRNPFKDIDRMKESRNLPKNILLIEEMGKLLENISVKTKDDLKFKTIIELLYSTGARISEIEHLMRDDIHLESGYIVIRDDKERQDRRCPLTEICRELLKIYLKLNNYSNKGEILAPSEAEVFAHGAKRTLNHWVNDRLKSITKQLKLPEITCHGIRHTIATHLLKKGADLREVQEFLGHKRIKNTEIYTHVFTDDLLEILERTHPREIEFLVRSAAEGREGKQ